MRIYSTASWQCDLVLTGHEGEVSDIKFNHKVRPPARTRAPLFTITLALTLSPRLAAGALFLRVYTRAYICGTRFIFCVSD